jgi:hypothetical protein
MRKIQEWQPNDHLPMKNELPNVQNPGMRTTWSLIQEKRITNCAESWKYKNIFEKHFKTRRMNESESKTNKNNFIPYRL